MKFCIIVSKSAHMEMCTLASSDSQIPRLLDGLIPVVSHLPVSGIRQNMMSTQIGKGKKFTKTGASVGCTSNHGKAKYV